MTLTGRDVWEAIVKLGMIVGPYDPKTNRRCANAEKIASLLNEVLRQQESNWLPNLTHTENKTPREYVPRLYKFLNLSGYTVVGIDAASARRRSGGLSRAQTR